MTEPATPTVILQTDLPHGEMRSNSLDLAGDLLVVACQTARVGLEPAGFEIFDVGDPGRPRSVAFFARIHSGPRRRATSSPRRRADRAPGPCRSTTCSSTSAA